MGRTHRSPATAQALWDGWGRQRSAFSRRKPRRRSILWTDAFSQSRSENGDKQIATIYQYAVHRLKACSNRGNITADVYADFCREAALVREALGLSNFTELDAVFNYAYWDKRPRDEEDEG